MTLWKQLPFVRTAEDRPASPKPTKTDATSGNRRDGAGSVQLLPVIVTGRDIRLRSWVGRFIETLAAVGLYAVIGIATGLVILARNHILAGFDDAFKYYPTAPELLDHIGSAFIVSAIVVVMYEWGSATKHSLDLAGALTYALQNHIDIILNRSAHEQIANSMRQIAGWGSEPFARQLKKFAEAIKTLSEKERDWAAPAYRDFIEWYHEQLTRYAHELADLSTNLREDSNSRTEFRFVLPAATDVADVMLERVTKEMGAKGTYYAISNAFTWTKLSRFRTEQQKAIKEGLQVRRIFIVGTDPDSRVDSSVAFRVLLGHFKDATESPDRYKIKLIELNEWKRQDPELPTHFGIFEPRSESGERSESDQSRSERDTPVIFRVLNNELTQFVMTGEAETSPTLIAFKQLWDSLPIELPASNSTEIIWDYLLASRIWQMEKKGHSEPVRGVLPIRVHLEIAQQPAYPQNTSEREAGKAPPSSPAPCWPREFDRATIDPKRPAEDVKRLFVIDSAENLNDPEVHRLLQRHYLRARTTGYECRFALRTDLPESIREETPFVLIGNQPPEGTKDYSLEVVQQIQQNAFDRQSEKAELLFDGFNAAWTQAGDFEASLKKVLTASPGEAEKLLMFFKGDHRPPPSPLNPAPSGTTTP